MRPICIIAERSFSTILHCVESKVDKHKGVHLRGNGYHSLYPQANSFKDKYRTPQSERPVLLLSFNDISHALISIECGVRCSSPDTIEISPLAVTNHSPHLLLHQEIVLKLSMLKSIHLLLDDATWFVRRPSLKFCVLVVILSLLEMLSLSFVSM